MLINFKNKISEASELYFGSSEIIIEVEKYAFLPIKYDIRKSHYGFSNIISKIIFFIFHEGLKLTLNKIKSYRLQRKVDRYKQIAFVYGKTKGDGRYAVAIGPQIWPFGKYLSFPKNLVVIIGQNHIKNVEKYYHSILEYFKKNPAKLESLYHYSIYSGNKIDINLKKIINIKMDKLNLKRISSYPLREANFIDEEIKQKRNSHKSYKKNKYDLFMAGAGSYPCSYILPFLKGVNYHTIIDINPLLASTVGNKYRFKFIDNSCSRALLRLKECENPLLIIATYHSTHFSIAEEALSINPETKIMLEKPPVTDKGQLEKLLSFRREPKKFIEIGYNRRYAPFAIKVKNLLEKLNEPMTITCIIKELNIPSTHWYYWPSQGTRATGNLCHWIDLGIYFIQREPEVVTAISGSNSFPANEISVSIKFKDGSLLILIASDRGNRLRGVQEYIDIRCGNLTISIDDFIKMRIQKGGIQRTYRRIRRNKGHINMYKNFMERIQKNENPLYPNRDLKISTELYLLITDLLLSGKKTAVYRNSNI